MCYIGGARVGAQPAILYRNFFRVFAEVFFLGSFDFELPP